jgi:hypothetical protein
MDSTRPGWDSHIKRAAALLSGGAALVSILSFLVGRRSAPEIVAGMPVVEVDRLELLPASDTAFALGDTLRLTALAADARGMAVLPTRIQWQTDDSAVAVVDSTGRVQARGTGRTLVAVAAGGRMARAVVWVLPRVTELIIAGDSVLRVAEGGSLPLQVAARDARGNRIPAPGLRVTVADEATAALDSNGHLRAITPGSTTVSATFGDLLVQRRIEVVTVPASLTLSGGGGQRAATGGRLPAPVAVQVVSRSGRPVPQVRVLFDGSGSGGQLTPDTATSDSAGVARVHWTLGARPGRQQILAAVAGIDSPLVVTAEADPLPAATRVSVQADSLVGRVVETLAQPVAVQLTDTSGVALGDVPVAWEALDGGEAVAVSARTDSLGVAQARWTLGRRAGRQRLQVRVGNPRSIPPRIVTAEARPGAARQLTISAGNDQKGTVGKPIPREVVLVVSDSLGNPIGDVPVQFRRVGRAAGDSVIRSGSDGRIHLRWTLPRSAGLDGFTARLPGGADSARVLATARPGAVDTVRFIDPPATAVAGRPAATTVRLRVTDRHGNPVPAASVVLGATAGKLSRTRATTDSNGVVAARWTPGAAAGTQTLTATVSGGGVRTRHAVKVTAPAPAGDRKRRK